MQEKQYQESIRQYNEQMEYQKQQDAIANAQTWAKINASSDNTDFSDSGLENTYALNERIIMANPYTKTVNEDAKYGVFSYNGTEFGYQPNNIQGRQLSKSGYKVGDLFSGSKGSTGISLDSQNIWETADGRYYVWDGSENKYNDVTDDVKNALSSQSGSSNTKNNDGTLKSATYRNSSNFQAPTISIPTITNSNHGGKGRNFSPTPTPSR